MNQDEGLSPELKLQLDEVIAQYLGAIESGVPVDREELLARHPELSDHLRSFFAAQDESAEAGADCEAPTLPPGDSTREAPTLPPSPLGEQDTEKLPPEDVHTIGGRGEATLSRLSLGSHFGDYELLEEIARGGMGVVYKARQVKLNRIVALKMILAGQLASEEDVQRFYTEAEAAANLDHPGIVPIYEVGQYAGQHFFSMGFVEGQSLAHKVADGPLPPREAAELVKSIAEAIGYAHEHGVIHRDLKPGNVLLDLAGHPRITDFGLAKQTEHDSQLTGTGQILGTPSYMPPEQAAGDPTKIGPAADIYALGAILYCLLTGRPPFQADNVMDTLMQVLEKEPVPPGQLNPKVPKDLETITLKCLEKSPHRRYPTAGALSDELQRFLNDEPIEARPISRPAKAWRWCKRHPALAALTAVSVVGAIALVSTLVVSNVRIRSEQSKTNQALGDRTRALNSLSQEQKKTQAALDTARRQERLAKHRLYAAHMIQARQAWQDDRIATMRELLEKHRPRLGEEDYRGWEWFYLKSLLHRDLITLEAHKGSITVVAWGRSNHQFATVGADGRLKLWDGKTGKCLWNVLAHPGRVETLEWSHNDRFVSTSGKGIIKIWKPGENDPVQILRTGDAVVSAVSWSPDDSQLASAGADERVRIWNITTAKQLSEFRHNSERYVLRSVAWTPDGKQLATVHFVKSGHKGVCFWDAKTGERKKQLYHESHGLGAGRVLAWHPTLRMFATGHGGGVFVWSEATGRPVHRIEHFDLRNAAWSPDGKTLATASGDQTVRIYRFATTPVEVGGSTVATLRGHVGSINSVSWSFDGGRIATASSDGKVKVWDVTKAEEEAKVRKYNNWATCVDWSPDGKTLATAWLRPTIELWNLDAGKKPRSIKAHRTRSWDVTWSPDGRQFAVASSDRIVKILDVNGSLLQTFDGHRGAPGTQQLKWVDWQPQGRRIASGTAAGTIIVWDADTGGEICRIDISREAHFAWSPDGRFIGSGFANDIGIWSPENGKLVGRWRTPGSSVSVVTWSPDGSKLGWGTSRGDVGVSDVWTGEVLYSVRGHGVSVTSIAWSPNGRRLASGDRGGMIKVRDAKSGEEVLALPGHTRIVSSLDWSPDGRRLASASWDSTVKVWGASTGYEMEVAAPTGSEPLPDKPVSPERIIGTMALRLGGAGRNQQPHDYQNRRIAEGRFSHHRN